MSCHVAVDQTTASMLDDYEHVQHAEARCDGEAEITGEDSSGVQAHNCQPAQVPPGAAWRMPRHVFTHGTGRDPDAKLL